MYNDVGSRSPVNLVCSRPRFAGKGADMNIIGCDLHTRYQMVAWIDRETGEIRTRKLEHGKEEVRAFYAGWPRGTRIGIEATLPALWFERLLAGADMNCG